MYYEIYDNDEQLLEHLMDVFITTKIHKVNRTDNIHLDDFSYKFSMWIMERNYNVNSTIPTFVNYFTQNNYNFRNHYLVGYSWNK